jgi:hypothetical protein
MDYPLPPDGAVFSDDEDQTLEAFAADSSRNTVTADRCQVLVVRLGHPAPSAEAGHLELLSAFLGLPVVTNAPAADEAELIVDEGQACIRFRDEGFPITAYRKSQVARRVTLAELHAGSDVRLDAGAVLSAMIDILDMIKKYVPPPKKNKASKRRRGGQRHAPLSQRPKSKVSSMLFMVPAALTEIDEPDMEVYGRSYGGNSVACVSTLGSVRTMLSTSAHEILHCYQVEHCVAYKCLMNS